jgi:fucokinase
VPGDSGWDYLILTASNALQGQAYEAHLGLRRTLGLLPRVRHVLVVPDAGGERIGSGGATLGAIERVLDLEGEQGHDGSERVLRSLRILIVHAGGDSRRLPAYGPCGKIFVPLPGEGDPELPPTLFDRLIPAFLDLPSGAPGRGQVVVAAGDALLYWDISGTRFEHPGITMLGSLAAPGDAARHGVFCVGGDDSITRYLQKPTESEQRLAGAVGPSGESVLDVGVMSMDAASVVALLRTFTLGRGQQQDSGLASRAKDWIRFGGLDLYREVCCALGSAATLGHYIRSALAGGSAWSEEALENLYPTLHEIPAHVHILPYCRFLHFGSTRQLAESGLEMMRQDCGAAPAHGLVTVNNIINGAGSVTGLDSWVEGCRISAPLELAGRNVVVGVDVHAPLSLPPEACLEVLGGLDRQGEIAWFARLYGVRDTFKDSVLHGGLFCGQPLLDWIRALGADPDLIWPGIPAPAHQTLWNACLFPAEASAGGYRRWLWLYAPGRATPAQRQAYISADRYSAAQIALLADQPAFHLRRLDNWAGRRQDPRNQQTPGSHDR